MKLLCIGNSITLHAPNTELGWHGNWGMAASAQERDYVHLLAKKLEAAGKTIYLLPVNFVTLEREPESFSPALLEEWIAFVPDAVVIRLGENVPGPEKYDDYIPDPLLRRAYAADRLRLDELIPRAEEMLDEAMRSGEPREERGI